MISTFLIQHVRALFLCGRRFPALLAFLIIAAAPVALIIVAAPVAQGAPGVVVIMQGLDKVTARVTRFEAPIGATVLFGPLRIVAHACDRTPPEEPPESAAYLEIEEAQSGEAIIPLFQGWMFASSPALSALEHPVYDVWVLECRLPAPQ